MIWVQDGALRHYPAPCFLLFTQGTRVERNKRTEYRYLDELFAGNAQIIEVNLTVECFAIIMSS